MSALLSIWTWLEISLIALLGFVAQLVLAVFTLPFDRRRLVVGRWYRLMAVLAAKLSPFWRFGVLGEVPRRLGPKTVIVSNHESQADPFLMSFLPWEMKYLGKASLFLIPVVGWAIWLAGDVPVKRGDPDSIRKAMGRMGEWLKRGVPVVIFPEGTRSKTEELLPFKDGAFRLAIENGADVLPIAVRGTRRALPKHSWRFGSARALVTVGTPIPTAGMTLGDLERLKGMAREQVESLRGRLTPVLAS